MHRRAFLERTLYVGAAFFTPRAGIENATRAMSIARFSHGLTLNIGAIVTDSAAHSGAVLGVDEANRTATNFGAEVTLATESMFGTVDNVAPIVRRMTLQQKVCAIVGGGSEEQCIALSEACAAQGVLFLNTSSTSDALRGARCNVRMFHVAPSASMLSDALRMADSIAASTPTPADSQAITNSAISLHGVSDTARDSGTRVVAWHPSLNKYGADTLNTRFRARFGEPMTELAWCEWFAIKVLWETCVRLRTSEPQALLQGLVQPSARFDGHKGRQLSFRSWDHQLRQPLFAVVHNSGTTRTVELPAASGDKPAQQELDEIGVGRTASACAFTS